MLDAGRSVKNTIPILHVVLYGVNLRAEEGAQDVERIDQLLQAILSLSFSILSGSENPVGERQGETLSSIASRSPATKMTASATQIHLERMIHRTHAPNTGMKMLRSQAGQGHRLLEVNEPVLVPWKTKRTSEKSQAS